MADLKPISCLQCSKDLISLLADITQTLNENRGLEPLLHTVLKSMNDKLYLERGMVTILNRVAGQIHIEESYGLSELEEQKGVYELGEGIIGQVAESGKPITIRRISQSKDFLNKTGARNFDSNDDWSFICVPIKIGFQVVGTLVADRKYNPNYELDEDVRIMTIIAAIIAQALHVHQLEHEERATLKENVRLQNELKAKFKPENIIGNSKEMKAVYELIEKIAPTNATVLILGESGVGKELVANSIHYSGKRADFPFIRFNCAALPGKDDLN